MRNITRKQLRFVKLSLLYKYLNISDVKGCECEGKGFPGKVDAVAERIFGCCKPLQTLT